jgi:hypothetical protein
MKARLGGALEKRKRQYARIEDFTSGAPGAAIDEESEVAAANEEPGAPIGNEPRRAW